MMDRQDPGNIPGTVRKADQIPGTPPGDHAMPLACSNPFETPHNSRPSSIAQGSMTAASSAIQHGTPRERYFHSRRLKKGETEKPWLNKKDPREKWVTIIPLFGIFVGLVIAGLLVWDGLRTVVNHKYCLVLDEDWSRGINEKVWTTDRIRWIRKSHECTSNKYNDCVTATNITNGTIVNPANPTRLNTKNGASITYGRVEVVAKLPSGDWLWPAIWMMPVRSTYGIWPQSGEIDLAESRGNNWTYAQGGNNIVSSALHWGPNSANDAWWRTNVKRTALHTTYASGFHTFGLEWSEKYLFTYIDTRLLQVLYTNFNQPLWQRGKFPLSDQNGTRLIDPWSQTGRMSTPFDQDFYLILNVVVGGTNGWF